MSFSSVLVANRGEIAVRIGRTLRSMGLRWIAVQAPDDAGAPHTAADVSVAVPGYLDIPALIAAAQDTGAGAIHPGYGFLSENADFAQAVLDAGLTWIGPPPAAMRLMADKGAAKSAMAQAGVPVLPGHDDAGATDATLIAAAETVGFPLMVKAAAGGGGRGMRLVQTAQDLAQALTRARSESLKAFGSDRLILERAVLGARHVEVQVLADAHGGIIHLGGRDCSVQRRHQKVVEEAPAPGLPPDLAERMAAAAIAAARACAYRGAGTVEFLVGAGAFHFLEMNTRLQVEHPVTEAVTGLDLVEWQIRVAQGEPLPPQSGITLTGHAIEVRLCAEDPDRNFLPQTGRILHWAPPPGLRTDHALADGLRIGTGYDSLLAKLIAHGPDRETARRRLLAGLEQTELLGLTTNRAALAAILDDPVFAAGQATTGFLDGHTPAPAHPAEGDLLAAALLIAQRAAPGPLRLGWSNAPPLRRRMRLETGGAAHPLTVAFAATPAGLTARGTDTNVTLTALTPTHAHLTTGNRARTAPYAWDGATLWLDGRAWRDATHDPGSRTAKATGGAEVTAPMAGTLIAVAATDGALVAPGDVLAVIEAMKMEHPIRAGRPGRITALAARPGQQVAARQTLMRIEAEGP